MSIIKRYTETHTDEIPIDGWTQFNIVQTEPPGNKALSKINNLTLDCPAPEGATSGVVSVRIGLQCDLDDLGSRENYARADFPFDKGADISGRRPGPWVFGEDSNTYPETEHAFIEAIRAISFPIYGS